MRGYVMVGTNDLDKSEKFYNKLLDTVGLKKMMRVVLVMDKKLVLK